MADLNAFQVVNLVLNTLIVPALAFIVSISNRVTRLEALQEAQNRGNNRNS